MNSRMYHKTFMHPHSRATTKADVNCTVCKPVLTAYFPPIPMVFLVLFRSPSRDAKELSGSEPEQICTSGLNDWFQWQHCQSISLMLPKQNSAAYEIICMRNRTFRSCLLNARKGHYCITKTTTA